MKEEKRGKLQTTIGRVKKTFNGPFNPFKALSHIYHYFVCLGHGNIISVVGYGDLFRDHIVTSTWHVQRDLGILREGMEPVLPQKSSPASHDLQTHSGAIIRYHFVEDDSDAQVLMESLCKESSIITLCSEYKEPVLRNILKKHAATKGIYDYSKNNVDKE